MILHFGVLDVGYSDASGSGAKTTGDVAGILEKNYHVMATFAEMRRERIANVLADSMANSIQRLVATGMGARSSRAETLKKARSTWGTLTYAGDQKIEAEFRSFIFSNEMAKVFAQFTGTALSAAAVAGVNHRKKHPYAKANKPRPAFVDTGLYVASFRAWTTDSPGESVTRAPRTLSTLAEELGF